MDVQPGLIEQWAPYWGVIALGASLAAFVKVVDHAVLTPALARRYRWARVLDRGLWLVPFVVGPVAGLIPGMPVPGFVQSAAPLWYALTGVVALFLRPRIPFAGRRR